MSGSDAALLASAEKTIARGSQSFAAASRLLSPKSREDVVLLYAWCRHCDDIIDGQTLGHDREHLTVEEARRRLDQIRAKTDAALDGNEPDEPPFRALSLVVARHDVPARWPRDLIEGFALDVEGWTPQTFDDLLRYSYHVAGVVGLMMARIMGVRDAPTLARACDLGLAFQMTNIARDIVEDARAGRCYLPADWLEDAGIPPADIGVFRHRAAVWRVTERLLSEADGCYASALQGLRSLRLRDALAIAAAHAVYREIGVILRERQERCWERRASTSRTRKLALISRAGLIAARSRWRPAQAAPSPSLGRFVSA